MNLPQRVAERLHGVVGVTELDTGLTTRYNCQVTQVEEHLRAFSVRDKSSTVLWITYVDHRHTGTIVVDAAETEAWLLRPYGTPLAAEVPYYIPFIH